MFAGGFNVKNIGHEIINYYLPDDSDEYHVFVPSDGKAKDNVGIDSIIMLEKTNISFILKVVAVIKNPKKEKDGTDFSLVKYDGKSLNEIVFRTEKSEDEKDTSSILSTFKCKKEDYFRARESEIYLIPAQKNGESPFNKTCREKLISRFKKEKPGATLIELSDKKPWHNKSYVEESSGDYQQIINNIVNKATNNNNHVFASKQIDSFEYEQDNLLNYIDKEYDENAITSFLFSLLKEKEDLAKGFVTYLIGEESPEIKLLCKQKLALTETQTLINQYLVARKNKCKYKKKLDNLEKQIKLLDDEKKMIEDSNAKPFERGIIDLYIETNNSVIVIENKIKSDLNGKDVDEDGEGITQLSKYDKYLSLICNGKKCFLIVIAPDYNSDFKFDHGLKAELKVFKYSELHDNFFKQRLSIESQGSGVWENKYRLFLNALEKHSIRLEDEMLIRFKNAIRN